MLAATDAVPGRTERSEGNQVSPEFVGFAIAAVVLLLTSVRCSEYTLARLPLFIGAVVSLSFLLLLAAFRSLPVAPKAG
jgi:hypothetical protein